MASECRSNNAETGARFAALYADHIVIRDPLGVHENEDRQRLLSAMEVLYRWRPLFEAGIASHVARICTHCAASRLQRIGELQEAVPRITAKVARRFSKAKFAVERLDRNAVHVTVHVSESELAHGTAAYKYVGKDARPFLKMLGRRESAPLTFAAVRSSGIMSRVTEPIVHEFLMQQLHRKTSSPNAHYASNIPIDLHLANALAHASVRWPRKLIDALSHTVPVVAHTPLRDIVRFRLAEGAAFRRYRSHIRSVAEQARDPKALLDAADALRSDYAALEQALRASRSGLFRKARNELVLLGSIGIGVAGTLGVSALLPLLGAAGLRVLTEAVRPRVSDDVQKHPLYFLWRLQSKR